MIAAMDIAGATAAIERYGVSVAVLLFLAWCLVSACREAWRVVLVPWAVAHRLKIEIFDAIKRIQQGGTAILMAEQDAQSALRIADRVYVLEHGHVGREGTAAALSQDDYIRQAYLGVS